MSTAHAIASGDSMKNPNLEKDQEHGQALLSVNSVLGPADCLDIDSFLYHLPQWAKTQKHPIFQLTGF